MKPEPTEQQFLEAIKEHKLQSIKEDGVFRHLKFRRPDTITGWFDIITWKGTLCIDGDMGTFTFRRVEDMFKFFRASEDDLKRISPKTLPINPHYWHEKLVSEDVPSGSRQWDQEYFEESLKEHLDSYYEGDKEKIDKVWSEMEWTVLSQSEHEYSSIRAAMEFEDEGDRPFEGFWECDCKTYTYQFLWCLYAIVWGIKKYDEQKLQPVTV